MNWFLIALIPPTVWAATHHFDKYLLSKYFKGGGVGALLTVFFPHIGKENISRKILAQKRVAILVMFVGVYLINK